MKNWCHESSKRKLENDEFLNESVQKQKLDEWMHYDSDDSMDEYESEEKKVFHDVMDKVRTCNEKEWNQKYGKYRNEGMTREEASYKSEEKMLEKDLNGVRECQSTGDMVDPVVECTSSYKLRHIFFSFSNIYYTIYLVTY